MSYCPILSYQRDATATKYCMGIDCELADEAGECLIKQALQCYVSAERIRVAEENERIRKETEMMKTYFAIKKDGTRTPIQFLSDGDTAPYIPPAGHIPDPDFPKPDASYVDAGGITWVHQPTTEKYPHGGWYEDLSNLRKEPE
jgi:hypothetical protein